MASCGVFVSPFFSPTIYEKRKAKRSDVVRESMSHRAPEGRNLVPEGRRKHTLVDTQPYI